MSILGDRYKASAKKQSREREEEDELLVFGYSCKLYRDDEKALQEDNGDLLLPWMGDKSLMVDRYDIRNRLEDKSQFGLKSNLPVRLTKEEEAFERQLEEERYLFLGKDVLEEELLAEEERKRLSESFAPAGTYHAVGFSYNQQGKTARKEREDEPRVMVDQPQLIQHPPSSSVDIVDQTSDRYRIPKGLVVPENIQTPHTWKVHQIIQRTAKFISQQGTQMEIIIKTKQQYNAHFSFLHYNDRLFSYYKHLLRALVNKEYEPEEEDNNPEEESDMKENETKETNSADSSNDSDEEDDAYELHPLLRGSSSAPKTNSVTISSPLLRGGGAAKKTNSVTISSPLLAGKKTTPGGTSVNSAPLRSLTSDLPDYLYAAQPSYPGYGNSSAPWAQSTAAVDSSQSVYDQGRGASGYSTSSSVYQSPIVPPPPDLQSIIDKTAAYVAKNGPGFQQTLLAKHVGDPRFDFLSPWNTYHSYYQAMVQQGQLREYQDVIPRRNEPTPRPVEHIVAPSPAPNPNLQKLEAGAVKFKLAPKPAKAAVVSGVTLEEEEEDESETSAPSAKKARTNQNGEEKMDGKIQEFLHTVKSILI